MCDYSLHNVASRPARVGDNLVTKCFPSTYTRGFAAVEEPTVAVCVLPGTELAFEKEVEWDRPFAMFRRRPRLGTLVRFRQINRGNQHAHHDAVEFPNGEIILLTRLREGQKATVIQLPASSQVVNQAEEQAQSFVGA
jgi:hypothetical protein